MKAILTKYVGPTNTRGSRIIVSCEGYKSMSVGFDYEGDAHVTAVRDFCAKHGITGEMIMGGTETGYAFVPVDSFFRVTI